MASITRAIVLQRLEMKKTNEIMRTTAPRREPVRVKLQRVNAGFSETHPPDGQGEIWCARLKEALGTSSSDFVNASLFQLQRAAQLPCSGISELRTRSGTPCQRPARGRDGSVRHSWRTRDHL
jgi:hypothetical protein